MDIDCPWHYDARGKTATTTYDDHVRDMLELLALTDPGERVNRPGFGCGLRQLVFAPSSPELAAALQFTMQAAVQRELGDVLVIEDLQVIALEGVLRVTIGYVVLATGTRAELVAERGGLP